MPLHWVPLLTALLPIIAIHSTYAIAATEGHVPWCVPYVDSCTSISATGRHGIAYLVFKGTMIPAALLLMLYWVLTRSWLRSLGERGRTPDVVLALGVTGAVFLIVYTVALGAAGDAMQLQRRIGIVIYFAFTAFSQLLLVWRLGPQYNSSTWYRVLLGLCGLMWLTGLGTVVLDLSIDDYDAMEDAFEWVLALLMHLAILTSVTAWRQTGFSASFHTRKKEGA